jgi:hypothetical protein
MTISDCKTVEEVEALQCYKCSTTGQWGWCDAPHIKCEYKNRIKEILGETESRYTIRKHIMEV